jgi:putative tryptophan/tyrosine transport system substrate-binding protein
MRLLFIISVYILFLQAQTILVINSNSGVKKYTQAVDEFSKNFDRPYTVFDISNKSSKEIKEYLYDEYPDIVYTVGVKAYQYANEYIPEKDIYFSSIIDWKKLPFNGTRYGISNELHSGMQLTLIKTIFTNIKTIGVIHSKYTQNIINDLSEDAKKMGIEILPIKINEDFQSIQYDHNVEKSDAIMIIADPIFLNNEHAVENLFTLSQIHKKPIIAYHKLFIQYGATLVISVDNPTIGRQIAAMLENNLLEKSVENIHYPAGTNIIFNKKQAILLDVKFNPDISQIATEIIE